ncbi:MAG TPA: protein-glutamate O-methyltransferase CheR [Terriglobales bacterium]|nr:protein-glutamate O-methyltransferase CheR [Terriglobales bacterium]
MGISTVHFDYLRKLMRTHTAIVLDEGKEYIAESRLASLVYDEGFGSVDDLFFVLRESNFSSLHRRVVNAMTNNETWFFRDVVPFEALRKAIIPELMVKRAAERTLRIWSAACSSGQEPYSVVMMLRTDFPELTGWKVQVVATDVSHAVLERAQRGRYSQLEVNRGLPIPLLKRYFRQDGLDWLIADEIKSQVEFRDLNLSEPWALMPVVDVVLIRNVLIYFDVPTKQDILGRVRRQMMPDGFMLMGSAETTLNLDSSFERVQFESTAYYRPTSQG